MNRLRFVVLLCCALLASMGLQRADSDGGHGEVDKGCPHHRPFHGHSHRHGDDQDDEEYPFDPSFPFGDVRVAGTGMLSIGRTQTARMYDVNIGQGPDPCTVELSFLDSAGNVLSQSTETVAPGAAASLVLAVPPGLAEVVPNTKTFRGLTRLVGGSAEDGVAGCVFKTTVEATETDTGRVSWVFYPGTDKW